MGYNSKYTGEQVEDLLDQIDNKSNDESVVHLFGDEIIKGQKTFYDSVKFLNEINEDVVIDVFKHTIIKVFETDNTIIEVHPNEVTVGNSDSKLILNGSHVRPSYNGNDVALFNDLPTDCISRSEVVETYVPYAVYNALNTKVDNINDSYVTKDSLNTNLNEYATVNYTNTQLDKKVNKIEGKQLSTEDFTSNYKTKLDSLNNYDDSEVKAAINKINQNISNAVAFVDFYEGVSHVTTLENLPIDYRFIIAEISSDQSLSVSQIPSAGRELHLIVHNSSYAEMVITLPDSGKFVNTSDSIITMDPLSYVEINLISDGNIVYIKYA